MMNKTLGFALTLAGLTLASSAAAVNLGDPEAGQQIAENQCMACHATDGSQSNPQWPSLAGQHADYLLEALKQYKEGDRQNAVMQGQVSNLSLQDMRDVAAYYAEQDGKLYTPER